MATHSFIILDPAAFTVTQGFMLGHGEPVVINPTWDAQTDGLRLTIVDDDFTLSGGDGSLQTAKLTDASGTPLGSGQVVVEEAFVLDSPLGDTVTVYSLQMNGVDIGYIADDALHPGEPYIVTDIIDATDGIAPSYGELRSADYDDTSSIEVKGSGESDVLTSGVGADMMSGGAGNDIISSGENSDTVFGGAGNDVIDSLKQNGTISQAADRVDGGSGNDTISGSDGDDTLVGGSGADSINGGVGSDVLSGDDTFDSIGASGAVQTSFSVIRLGNAADVDQFNTPSSLLGTYGGEGSELFKAIQDFSSNDLNANDIIDSDTAFSSEQVLIDGVAKIIDTGILYDATVTFTDGTTGTISAVVGQTTDGDFYLFPELEQNADQLLLTSKPIESITLNSVLVDSGNLTSKRVDADYAVASEGDTDNDTILGGEGNDTIYGGDGDLQSTVGGGSDSLSGGDGDDHVFGQVGDDTLDGDAGNDYLDGGTGNDVISGGDGDDYIDGGDGDDILMTGIGRDTVFGGAGNDTIMNSAGNDSLVGGDGNDSIIATLGNDTLEGGAGNDTLDGGEDDDSLDGGIGDDVLTGGIGNDVISGGDGNDFIDGGDGDDFLMTGLGQDTILGGEGNDTIMNSDGDDSLVGGAGNDSIIATGGNDTLEGGDGNDTLDGGADNDSLVGGAGDDSLIGGIGNDYIEGGDGNDTIVYAPGDGIDTIADFNFGNTGTLDDGDTTNNDFINLSGFYDHISELYADQLDDGILNQSNATDTRGNTVDYSNNASFGTGSLTFTGASADSSSFTAENTGVVCFTGGTMILTPSGEMRIDRLRPGDLVTTRDNGPQVLQWVHIRDIGPDELAAAPELKPIAIEPGFLGVRHRLLVSPQHGMLVCRDNGDEEFVRAKDLARLEGGKVRVALGKRQVRYIHLLFEEHQVIFANGAPSESFFPGVEAFKMLAPAAKAEMQALFPDLLHAPAKTYGATARPFVPFRQLPDHLFELNDQRRLG